LSALLTDEELYFETCWDAEAVEGAQVTTVKTRGNVERVLRSMLGTGKKRALRSSLVSMGVNAPNEIV
jgi:hypothetical protein